MEPLSEIQESSKYCEVHQQEKNFYYEGQDSFMCRECCKELSSDLRQFVEVEEFCEHERTEWKEFKRLIDDLEREWQEVTNPLLKDFIRKLRQMGRDPEDKADLSADFGRFRQLLNQNLEEVEVLASDKKADLLKKKTQIKDILWSEFEELSNKVNDQSFYSVINVIAGDPELLYEEAKVLKLHPLELQVQYLNYKINAVIKSGGGMAISKVEEVKETANKTMGESMYYKDRTLDRRMEETLTTHEVYRCDKDEGLVANGFVEVRARRELKTLNYSTMALSTDQNFVLRQSTNEKLALLRSDNLEVEREVAIWSGSITHILEFNNFVILSD